MVNKANQVLGLIRRSVGTANTTTFSLLYKTLVRPLLEYAAPVWNPYLVKDMTVFSKLSIFWLVIGFTEYLVVSPPKGRRNDKNDKTR